ncbi:hypothetical protein HZA43_00195 [Candidatus Peregrinibacteria bacterium]|nr:hypothetical protein [Candidatus Peregrinibacteria bacterium]
MKKFLLLTIILLIIIISGFSFFAYKKNTDAKDSIIKRAEEKKFCEETGGKIGFVGFDGMPLCIHEYPDKRKPCTSSDECEGTCEANKDGAGFCKVNDNPYRCHLTIEDFRAGKQMLCID